MRADCKGSGLLARLSSVRILNPTGNSLGPWAKCPHCKRTLSLRLGYFKPHKVAR